LVKKYPQMVRKLVPVSEISGVEPAEEFLNRQGHLSITKEKRRVKGFSLVILRALRG
jgi:hypothetical protein